VKTVVRLCLLKCASKEVLLRTSISKALKDLSRGVEYVKCIHSILRNAQFALDSCFGLTLYALPDIKAIPTADGSGCGGVGNTSAAQFLVFNALRSVQVQAIHADNMNSQGTAYMAFVFIVLQAIHTAPGQTEEKSVERTSLLRKLRTLDSRFPETLQGVCMHACVVLVCSSSYCCCCCCCCCCC